MLLLRRYLKLDELIMWKYIMKTSWSGIKSSTSCKFVHITISYKIDAHIKIILIDSEGRIWPITELLENILTVKSEEWDRWARRGWYAVCPLVDTVTTSPLLNKLHVCVCIFKLSTCISYYKKAQSQNIVESCWIVNKQQAGPRVHIGLAITIHPPLF